MKTAECQNLDDYLSACLSDDEAARFEAHLAHCPACREETADQRGIDRLLARGAAQRAPTPSSLVDRIEGQIRSLRRRRVIRTALALSAAAAVVLAVGVWLIPQNDGTPAGPTTHAGASSIAEERIKREPDSHADRHEAAPPAQLASDGKPRVRVSLADPAEAILVPVETSNPNVSIVWIYPTVRPGRAAAEPAAGAP